MQIETITFTSTVKLCTQRYAIKYPNPNYVIDIPLPAGIKGEEE